MSNYHNRFILFPLTKSNVQNIDYLRTDFVFSMPNRSYSQRSIIPEYNSDASNYTHTSELSRQIGDLNNQLNKINESLNQKELLTSKEIPQCSQSAQGQSSISQRISELSAKLEKLNGAKSVQNTGEIKPTTTTTSVTEARVLSETPLNNRLLDAGYDKATAEKLAAQSINETAGRTKSIGWCAKYVNNALENAGLVEKNSTRRESAYMLTEAYANNPAFAKVEVSKDELKDLPAGCIVVWQPGKGFGNAFAQHGHVFITQGNGKASSDYLQDMKDYGTQFTVFVPKKQG